MKVGAGRTDKNAALRGVFLCARHGRTLVGGSAFVGFIVLDELQFSRAGC